VSTNLAGITEKNFSGTQGREWLAGFFLMGLMLGLLGSLQIAWQYHIDTQPQVVGIHFLALNAGYVLAVAVAQRVMHRVRVKSVALGACALSFLSLLALSFLSPPIPAGWRIVDLAFLGCAAGGLMTALLYALEGFFSRSLAAAVNRAGLLFGTGCLAATVTVGAAYYAGTSQIETAIFAAVAFVFLLLYARTKWPAALQAVTRPADEPERRKLLKDMRSIAAVLFSLLLFFQFGNEWAIAGWLPQFLIHQLGANPMWAIFALGVYFLALMVGRWAAQFLLTRFDHRKLLVGSITLAMAGYVWLSFTTSMAGAWVAIVLVGAGFAPIYPLVAENLDDRFSYHPGFYNGIFSIAITGAMSAPWLLGYVAEFLGMAYVMIVPALGSIAVLIVVLLIMLEARLMGTRTESKPQKTLAAPAGK
jgi:FHS family glucose/mannose:H+ symporter-like MFS transporter